jgi:hypothetical protein
MTPAKRQQTVVQWDGTFIIDGTRRGKLASMYITSVANLLHKIGKYNTGWLVLDAVRGSRKRLTIRSASPLLTSIEANPSDKPHKFKDGTNTHCAVPADSVLDFEPAPWLDATTIDPQGNFKSDDVLVHELVHEARQMRGMHCREPMGDGFETKEEFYAVVIANIYRSEKSPSNALRADYSLVWRTLTLSDDDFHTKYILEIQQLKVEMPRLFTGLSQVKAGWNPFRVEEAFVEQMKNG